MRLFFNKRRKSLTGSICQAPDPSVWQHVYFIIYFLNLNFLTETQVGFNEQAVFQWGGALNKNLHNYILLCN